MKPSTHENVGANAPASSATELRPQENGGVFLAKNLPRLKATLGELLWVTSN